ncbi:hypothetical protein B0H63DRAFT_467598 [Podospora didyma]|uniref:Transglutaminase-like domain-containing protein n=1 Tax=Podospora didyma TaxID=330526 RepID=A0AAE0P0W6_9PEZI|nr:hypothetical protein B0H63DRAFT_467598 [Podospora didyma]
MAHEFWTQHSPVTTPGAAAAVHIDALPSDLASLRHASSQFVFHFRGDFAKHGVPEERRAEISLRYADAMFSALLSRSSGHYSTTAAAAATTTEELENPLSYSRDNRTDRVVGCARDAVVLFVAMARQKGIPARGRVGFASYFEPGWFMDHVVAEVWDASQNRWRLVETMPVTDDEGQEVDYLDLKEDEFVTAPRAWQAARQGKTDPGRYVVDPSLLEVPILRGWPYLAHNLIHDLAWMNKNEMLLWDHWGVQDELRKLEIGDELGKLLDEVGEVMVDVDVEPAVLVEMFSRDGLHVPKVVGTVNPSNGAMEEVDIGRAIGE